MEGHSDSGHHMEVLHPGIEQHIDPERNLGHHIDPERNLGHHMDPERKLGTVQEHCMQREKLDTPVVDSGQCKRRGGPSVPPLNHLGS